MSEAATRYLRATYSDKHRRHLSFQPNPFWCWPGPMANYKIRKSDPSKMRRPPPPPTCGPEVFFPLGFQMGGEPPPKCAEGLNQRTDSLDSGHESSREVDSFSFVSLFKPLPSLISEAMEKLLPGHPCQKARMRKMQIGIWPWTLTSFFWSSFRCWFMSTNHFPGNSFRPMAIWMVATKPRPLNPVPLQVQDLQREELLKSFPVSESKKRLGLRAWSH